MKERHTKKDPGTTIKQQSQSPQNPTPNSTTPQKKLSRRQSKAAQESKNNIKETCPSFKRGHLPLKENAKRYRNLSAPHVESFDYFLEHGLDKGANDIEPVEIDLIDYGKSGGGSSGEGMTTVRSGNIGDDIDPTTTPASTHRTHDMSVVRVWFENVRISPPTGPSEGGRPMPTTTPIIDPSLSIMGNNNYQKSKRHTTKRPPITPRECRELGELYAGPMTGDICVQVSDRSFVSMGNGTGAGTTGNDNDGGNNNDLSNVVALNGTVSEVPGRIVRFHRRFGDVPIMIMSKGCHLRGKKPEYLARLGEEDNEFGGYFVVNGIERCVRMLQVPRRNHAHATKRSAFTNRGSEYTDLGVSMRCARHNGDCTTVTNTVHYLNTGGANLKFILRRQEFFIPVAILLKALSFDTHYGGGGGGGITDEELYHRIMGGVEEEENDNDDDHDRTYGDGDDDENNDNVDTFLRARVQILLREGYSMGDHLTTAGRCLAFIGSRFRSLSGKSRTVPDEDVGRWIMDRFVMVHLKSYGDKMECVIHMLRKLYALASGGCSPDNADSLQNQELLVPGHLMSMFVKEKLEEMLQNVRLTVMRDVRIDYTKLVANLGKSAFLSKLIDRNISISSGGIGHKISHFLSTGNIISSSGLDLQQTGGFTIVAEKLNFWRFCGHFRAVHRGAFFTEMRTTAVRKLLPESWGFLCPVHTPDGAPCGLLSHLSLLCRIIAAPADDASSKEIEDILVALGVARTGTGGEISEGRAYAPRGHLSVCLDGRIIGSAAPKLCDAIATKLRRMKIGLEKRKSSSNESEGEDTMVPATLEVALIPSQAGRGGPFPGLFLFTGAARLVRPVLHRATGLTEMIGPMEQPFLDIACLSSDVREGITTHQELEPNNLLSLVASLTPFSDYNQSPRNMYQCQMAKQTMGTPCHSFPHRSDNKMYRLQHPQAPIAQTSRQGEYVMDEYPNGTNAVVAVLSYTGFDMEDAMILNKCSYERGFGHATVYKTEKVDLKEVASGARSGEKSKLKFSNPPAPTTPESFNGLATPSEFLYRDLDEDGLPLVGTWKEEGDSLHCTVEQLTGKAKVKKYMDKERACIQNVKRLGLAKNGSSTSDFDEKVSITLRIPRNPIIGDKFASRHGQKGVLSIFWPQEDMPFSESGISPDIIINPHAFPSRMTIGMLIESMAGKSGALHGMFQDATPFTFHETGDKIAIDYFGEQLQKAGYNYYGSEPLYSGVSGCLMQADLYIGVVYYQRLRHMVSDKYQVRATGQVNNLTRQPIKGRKKGGGIRLGEMERDCLLSHGTAFILHDRLVNCSDRHVAYVCRRCGDLLNPTTESIKVTLADQGSKTFGSGNPRTRLRVYCRNPKCQETIVREGADDPMVEPIVIPFVYRYLANELAGMNIKMTMTIK